ncbi:c-type cytochrome [Pseudemcibacter aquimaris]|uniref:c-type cytochrome n=1 Tax=Pseudemcibacter aquimaris TaxID=2857064 RepID=UPI002013926C|nr:c-type cytochrome [Pseudemcibacter aquimaris]MCC3861152.1 cytochrome c [Pseudemcibacter aquimaris]WDU59969.1 cytochrome c [Pseudemcibacter aquimaris]
MKYIKLLFIVLTGLFLVACDDGPKGSFGFTLPDGNAEYGQQYFVEFRCVDCHTVVGLEDELVAPFGIDPIMNVPLGGATHRIETYGELVTSIINPSHKVSSQYKMTPDTGDGQSVMRNYNSIMTVDELIDIVAFVQDQYTLKPYPPTTYKIY